MIYNEEIGRLVPLKRLVRHLDVKGWVLYSILNNESYKDWVITYSNITQQEKDKMASFLREKEQQTSRIAGNSLRSTNHNIPEKKI